jgi:hypothetical protein
MWHNNGTLVANGLANNSCRRVAITNNQQNSGESGIFGTLEEDGILLFVRLASLFILWSE